MDAASTSASLSRLKPKRLRRYNTVHDLAALRLHPDGSRVAANPASVNAKTLLYARSLRHAGPDAHGNWIARDAAGLRGVKRRRTMREESAGGDEGEGEMAEEDEEIVGAPEKRPRTARARRRRNFLQKLQDVQGNVFDVKAGEQDASDDDGAFPAPSAVRYASVCARSCSYIHHRICSSAYTILRAISTLRRACY
jgi:hypothetical protein